MRRLRPHRKRAVGPDAAHPAHPRGVRAERIDRLRQQMNQLLQEMAAIRKSLPGEYRNLEASSALQVEDQLSRINDAINEGDLEAAFQELDAISGMLEQMQRSLDQAEEDYGDERYDELRQEMDEAMSNLSEVESRQEELNQATEKLYEDAKERHFQEAQTTEASLKEKLLKEIRAALLSLDNATETQLLQSGHRQFGVTRENLLDVLSWHGACTLASGTKYVAQKFKGWAE